MSRTDFVFGVISSLFATILFELGRTLYPRLKNLLGKVNTLGTPLKKSALDRYEYLKHSASRVLQHQKATLIQLTSKLAFSIRNINFSRPFEKVSEGLSEPRYSYTVTPLAYTASLLVFTIISIWPLLLWEAHRQRERNLSKELMEASVELTEKQLLDISRNVIEQRREIESSADAFLPVQAGNHEIRISTKASSPFRVIYRAEGGTLPAPMEAKIYRNEGVISIMRGDEPEVKTRFFVGIVGQVSKDTLTLLMSCANGTTTAINLSMNGEVNMPFVGQRVFAATESSRVKSLQPL